MINGWIYWQLFRIKHRINYHKVVVFLTGDDMELDKSCIKLLPFFMKRKYVDKAVVFYSKERYSDVPPKETLPEQCYVHAMNEKSMAKEPGTGCRLVLLLNHKGCS